jgi:hypothetical protein
MIVSPDVKEGVHRVPLKWNARLLSVIDIDDSGYTIRFGAVNLIGVETS